jgi:hypothetical protein
MEIKLTWCIPLLIEVFICYAIRHNHFAAYASAKYFRTYMNMYIVDSELASIGFYGLAYTHTHTHTHLYIYYAMAKVRRVRQMGTGRGKYAHIYMTEFTIVMRVRFWRTSKRISGIERICTMAVDAAKRERVRGAGSACVCVRARGDDDDGRRRL